MAGFTEGAHLGEPRVPEMTPARLEARYQILLANLLAPASPGEAALRAWTEGDNSPAKRFWEYLERRTRDGRPLDLQAIDEQTLRHVLVDAGIAPALH